MKKLRSTIPDFFVKNSKFSNRHFPLCDNSFCHSPKKFPYSSVSISQRELTFTEFRRFNCSAIRTLFNRYFVVRPN